MLESEEVDEGYFTPIASATLANIFRDDSTNDETTNASLKYKAPQPNKSEKSPRTNDSSTTQCIFSCSLIAYEWIQGAHQSKGKVGFAIMQIIRTGLCKIILYSPDKSTLSCTTISPQLEVTVKGAMISLFDDHKKYWGLCFNGKVIDEVRKILQRENVIINLYENPQHNDVPLNLGIENIESNTTDETDIGIVTDLIVSTSKASILSRIANVGHAILPTPSSPTKKTIQVERLSPTKTLNSIEESHVLQDGNNTTSSHLPEQNLTRSIAVQASHHINTAQDTRTHPTNINQISVQHSITSAPFVNNQVFTYINGCMVPVHMQVPVISNPECSISTADIEGIIHKLTHLQGLVKAMENIKSDTENSKQLQYQQYLSKISSLEEIITKKDDVIFKLQSDLSNERRTCEMLKKQLVYTSNLEKQLFDLNQDLIVKDEKICNMILKSEANNLLASKVKKLMNYTFRSLASNFENEGNYSGNEIKAILATVIKKCTVESFKDLAEQQ